MPTRVHRYQAQLSWSGSTGAGWGEYDRGHTATAPPAEQELGLTTGEDQGDQRLLNPEQLVVIAASSCQMLWFLHLAAKARIDVVGYDDQADAEMPEDEEPVRLTRITLRPRIEVAGEANEERVLRLAEKAHELCYVANSLTTEVRLEPSIHRRDT
jgi:organic hydroperoxide reductase OsmC/OhrA